MLKQLCLVVLVGILIFGIAPSETFGETKERGIQLIKEGLDLCATERTEDVKTAIGKFHDALRIFEAANLHAEAAWAFDNLGIAHFHLEEFNAALEYFKKSLELKKRTHNPKGEAQSLNNIGSVYSKLQRFDEARKYFEKALLMQKELNDIRRQVQVLMGIGMISLEEGKYDEASAKFADALKKAVAAKDTRTRVSCLINLGETSARCGNYVEAEKRLREAVELSQSIQGDLKFKLDTKLKLGRVLYSGGKYKDAVRFAEACLKDSENLANPGMKAEALILLGSACREMGKFEESLKTFDDALALQKSRNFKRGVADVLNEIGLVHQETGRYADATKSFLEAQDVARKASDKKTEARSLNNLGTVELEQCDFENARDHFEQSIAVKQQIRNRLDEGRTLSNLGNLFHAQGFYEEAQKYYGQALQAFKSLQDNKNGSIVHGNLGKICQDQGDYAEAEEEFKESLQLAENDEASKERRWDNLANLYLDWSMVAPPSDAQKKVNQASDYVRRIEQAPSIERKGAHNSSVGRFYLLRGEHQKAKRYYESLLQSAEKKGDLDDLFAAYTGLGLILEREGQFEKAKVSFEKAIKVTEKVKGLLVDSAERSEFFSVRTRGFIRTDPYKGLARVLFQLDKRLDAFETSEYTKSRIFADVVSRRHKEATLNLPDAARKEGDQINNQLTALMRKIRQAQLEGRLDSVKSIEPQLRELENRRAAYIKMLRKDFPLFAATQYPEPIGLSQSDLKDSEWVVAYDVTDLGLLIYLIKGKTLLKGLFKPVPRKEVDDLVTKFRVPLEPSPGESDPSKSEKERDELLTSRLKSFDSGTGKKLSDILLADIIPALPKDAPLIIIPDECLGVLPFEMLVLNDGGQIARYKDTPYVMGVEFFGDRNPISYCQSVTALTLARTFGKQKESGDKRLVMYDPIFDTNDSRFQQVARKKRKADLNEAPDRLLAAIKRESKSEMMFPQLKVTNELGVALKNLDPSRTEQYTAMEASKQVLFDKPLDRYKSMVFATHGYFGKEIPGIKEPVLVLTLVNQPAGKDGYLRLSEVMGLKLNADIVALTACQTGLGRLVSGEGTMGMGRAFQYAGAKSVLMSLWSVSERASVNLVKSFFRNLNEGKNKLEALELARDELRKDKYDHPFYWAPFILVGEVN